jgi:hypothetical protein
MKPSLTPLPTPESRILLDVRPDGFTLLADIRYDEPFIEPDPAAARLLATTMRRVDDFIARVQNAQRLQDENERLRAALADCASACSALLASSVADDMEGREGERAEAWLAIDAARQLLNERPQLKGV